MNPVKIYFSAGAVILVISTLVGWNFLFPSKEFLVGGNAVFPSVKKTQAERIAEAAEKSKNIKGLYMTADVANDQGAAGTRLRKNLIKLAEETEINSLVIDVKEVCGPEYNEESIKKLLSELKEKNIWAIARIAVFKDASQFNAHPEWYLQRKNAKTVGTECWNKKYLQAKPATEEKTNAVFWRDKRGGYWLDPASPGTRNYILEISKKMIDLGFDELQFDYIRFPSDGDIQNIIYPVYDGKTSKCAVMKDFFGFLSKNLKEYKPEIILSADFFGYTAIGIDTGIGQCIESIADNFDFVSFMVYPSHYYSGLSLSAMPELNLPAINFNVAEARTHPDIVVERSLRYARSFFDGLISAFAPKTSTTTTPALPVKQSKACNRPWLEDFYHEEDKAAGRPYGIEKMRLQINAAERVDNCGWLLWNAANVYTEAALTPHL